MTEAYPDRERTVLATNSTAAVWTARLCRTPILLLLFEDFWVKFLKSNNNIKINKHQANLSIEIHHNLAYWWKPRHILFHFYNYLKEIFAKDKMKTQKCQKI